MTAQPPKPVSRITKRDKERAQAVARLFYENMPHEPKPALVFESPYQCVAAIALSAQTTDANVNKVTGTLFAAYPSTKELAIASQEDVEEIIHSLGFFRNKAKNLIAMAQKVEKDFGGEIPHTMEELITLPGVARKTANLVLAESFGIVSGIAVDTHVFRISHRLNLSRAKTPEQTEGDLCAVFQPDQWRMVNYWMIQLGRSLCDARKPQCATCFLTEVCPKKGVAPSALATQK